MNQLKSRQSQVAINAAKASMNNDTITGQQSEPKESTTKKSEIKRKIMRLN